MGSQMTRTGYLVITEAMGEAFRNTPTLTQLQKNHILYPFADVLKADNPNFDVAQFVDGVLSYGILNDLIEAATPDFEEHDED